ncbi:universal stress protein [Paenibacillus sp. B01]|uniref:universal stress protein n=1 Tax=Paenibacillus sp. B01 TaxID=2660554 RepID=UPI00129B2EAC|nr:universal stress protein [Paenibacillus sp. B01]QGG55941.1 histidine kinase [Paenibacillus sp. B01]
MPKSEHILVCLSYGPHGERLIRRGAELAAAAGSRLVVLSVVSDVEAAPGSAQEEWQRVWRDAAAEAGAEFRAVPSAGRKAVDVIAHTAMIERMTQIVVGQPVPTRWEERFHASFVDALLRRIGQTDLHVVAVQRLDEELERTHERGVRVAVAARDGGYVIQRTLDKNGCSGVFFRSRDTEFEHGLLKLKDGSSRSRAFKVRHGAVVDPEFPAFWRSRS